GFSELAEDGQADTFDERLHLSNKAMTIACTTLCDLLVVIRQHRSVRPPLGREPKLWRNTVEIGHYVLPPTIRSASLMRRSPPRSLGRSASRKAASVRDSRRPVRTRSKVGLINSSNASIRTRGGTTTLR